MFKKAIYMQYSNLVSGEEALVSMCVAVDRHMGCTPPQQVKL